MTWAAVPDEWPEHHIVPLITLRPGVGIQRVAGTGFFLGRDIFVTCWHCILGAAVDETFAASVRDPATGKFHALPLTNLDRDSNGADLALANVPTSPQPPLRLSDGRALQGEVVWSYGYPLVDTRQGNERDVIWRVTGRLLRGYVTQGTELTLSHGGLQLVYELDMPCPPGLSGAPLMLPDTREVVGVVQGDHTDTRGERVTTFGLALDLDVLSTARGSATRGATLRAHLRS